ncbi:MAG: hypothetical protein LC107_11815 [Chitinophagales bacterium]|nr:hypothetical protein [Chitinophagales bacterium]
MIPEKHNLKIVDEVIGNFRKFLKDNRANLVFREGKLYLKVRYFHSEYPGDSDFTSSWVELKLDSDTTWSFEERPRVVPIDAVDSNFETGEILP